MVSGSSILPETDTPGAGGRSAVSPPAFSIARAGRMTRLVLGAETPPMPVFFAPDAPAFTRDADALGPGADGAFDLAGVSVRVGHEPLRVDVDVGGADIYGFGAATGAPTRNGARFRIMTLDTLFYGVEGASYTAIPFFIARDKSGRTFGVMIATTYPLDVSVRDGAVTARAHVDTEGAPADVIVFTGAPREIVTDLASLVGKTFLPPAWALGFHQSRWSYKTSDVVLDVAKRFRAEELPADVIHLDIHYMDAYRVFTFSPERFPQPKKMHEELRALGFRTMAIIDPGVSVAPYPVFEELRSSDMLLKRRDGSAFEGKVWPGATVFPDFSHQRVREAWGAFHAPLVEAGVSGFWNDMNDPVFHVGRRYDPMAEDVRDHKKNRNVYANGMAQGTVAGLDKLRPGVRSMVLTRSGFLGIQRHSAVWTGDNHSTWEHLRENVNMALNLGVCGVSVVGADVGGFGRGPGKYGALKPFRPSAELFVRWMELGALMPFFRVHCTLYARRQEPWSFGKKALELSRRILRRRYAMLPLLYRAALEAHETGLPLVRPLWLSFDDVPAGAGDSQFLVGDALLAAPVLEAGQTRREVWLPPGTWVDWSTGDVHAGGRTVVVDAPLGATPLFVRGGAALFLAEPRRNAEETLRAPLSLEVSAPPPGERGTGSLFLDDGESAARGRFVLDAGVEDLGGRLRVSFERRDTSFTPSQADLELRAPRAFTAAVVDGVRVPLTERRLDDAQRACTVQAARVSLGAREIVLE